MNTNRIKKKVDLGDILDNLEGTIDNAINYLAALKDKHKDCAKLCLTVDYGYDSKQLNLSYERDEDDKEYAYRISEEKKREDNERACYLRLKAKFEKDEAK